MPFHLHRMGSNALGVFICQFALVAVIRNPSVKSSAPMANFTALQVRPCLCVQVGEETVSSRMH
jgi:hypothetical protein